MASHKSCRSDQPILSKELVSAQPGMAPASVQLVNGRRSRQVQACL